MPVAGGFAPFTVASGINDRTEIVGAFGPRGGPFGGFLLDIHGTFVFLNVPGATSTQPTETSGRGSIVIGNIYQDDDSEALGSGVRGRVQQRVAVGTQSLPGSYSWLTSVQ